MKTVLNGMLKISVPWPLNIYSCAVLFEIHSDILTRKDFTILIKIMLLSQY